MKAMAVRSRVDVQGETVIKKIVLLGLVVLSFQVVAPAHAKKGQCHRELAKGTAELAGNLQAGVYLCGKSTSAQVAMSRRDIERKSKENFPCAEDDFMGWYDSAYARAEAQWNLATKDQKAQVCSGLTNAVKGGLAQ